RLASHPGAPARLVDVVVARGELLRSAATMLSCIAAALVVSCAGAGPRPRPAASSLVLYEVHRAAGSEPHTLVTTIGESKPRVPHQRGIAVLDVGANRCVLLDPVTRTEHSMPLDAWERELRSTGARAGANGASGAMPARELRFEPEGEGGTIAGHACDR